MQPEIDAEGPVRQLAHPTDAGAQVVGGHAEARENAEPSRAAHLGHELGSGDSAHPGLEDGVLDAQEITERRAEDHDETPRRRRYSAR